MKKLLSATLACALALSFTSTAQARARKKRPPAPQADTPPPDESAAPPASAPATESEAPPTNSREDEAPPPPATEEEKKPAAPPVVAVPGWQDPTEKPNQKLLFIGFRYRGTIIPKFLMNLFTDEGRTVYSNSFGIELDMRHDEFSVIPSFSYTEYGMQDTLFLQKGKDRGNAANWSFVNSGLKAIYLGVDVLWSARLHRNIQLEYGLGIGVGAVFGDLVDNWVYSDGGGPLVASDGQHFSGCKSEGDGYGCSRGDHTSTDAKVNRYVEPNWYGGGPVPTLFARIAPTIGLRFKPMRDMEARLQIGWSLTEGFFFGLSADYRLPYEGKTTAASD